MLNLMMVDLVFPVYKDLKSFARMHDEHHHHILE